jgi:hydrogenase maturation protease
MTQLNPATTVVLGMGNLIYSDDGVGVHAVQRLQADRRVPADVLLLDGGTLGLTLLNHVSGARRLLVLDAVDIGAPAGTLVRMEGQELHGMPGSGSVHQLGFADLLAALRITGQEPQEVVVLGIQPGSTDLGTSLSVCVSEALKQLIEAAIAQVSKWSHSAGQGAGNKPGLPAGYGG